MVDLAFRETQRESVLPYRFLRCWIYYWAFYYELRSFLWEKDSSLFIRSQSVNGRNWEKGVGGPARASLSPPTLWYVFGRKLGRRVFYFLLVNFLLLKDRIFNSQICKRVRSRFCFLFIYFFSRWFGCAQSGDTAYYSFGYYCVLN